MKLYRFWQLRAKVYSAVDTQTLQYIVSGAESAIIKMILQASKTSSAFMLFEGGSVTTPVLYSLDTYLSAMMYEVVLFEDMGGFWNSTVVGILAEVNWKCPNPGIVLKLASWSH